MFPDYSFNVCRIYGDIISLISDVGNLVLLLFSPISLARLSTITDLAKEPVFGLKKFFFY